MSIPLVEHPFLGIGAKPSFDKCHMYDVDYDDVLRNNLKPNSSWKTKSCTDGWDYDFERTKYPTIVSEVKSTFSRLWFYIIIVQFYF